eukprot:CAMPEP_0198214908 /NCGR_PEP_ID=MMETSP1445-20131203/45303_1 /TAXON_ID=36898 /ORGANISM="Pyramimonas sp., Strain CCMP2087" /LENGTH=44 /DNA_ID= /DNA_START= /DNA_END= /DNA_ORIENTATION=
MDSPSMRIDSVLLAPKSFSSATTATGSVAARMLANMKENSQDQS